MKPKHKARDPRRSSSRAMVPAQPMSNENTFIAMVERVIRDPSVSKDKVEIVKELLSMRDNEQALIAKNLYSAAMSEAQAAMEPVRKDCKNKQTNSKYASYEALDKAIRPIYVKHGFALSFNTEPHPLPNWQRVTCDVSHKAGHNTHHMFDVPIITTGPQGKDVMTLIHATMSANTYGLRGLLRMIFNMVTTDDDGNAAGGERLISNEQHDRIVVEIEKKPPGPSVEKICAAFEINDLKNLPVDKYELVMKRISNYKTLATQRAG